MQASPVPRSHPGEGADDGVVMLWGFSTPVETSPRRKSLSASSWTSEITLAEGGAMSHPITQGIPLVLAIPRAGGVWPGDDFVAVRVQSSALGSARHDQKTGHTIPRVFADLADGLRLGGRLWHQR